MCSLGGPVPFNPWNSISLRPEGWEPLWDATFARNTDLTPKSVREIADILQKPKSTVSDEWKRRGSETAEKRTCGRKYLELVLEAGISVERERESKKNLGFCGRAAAHKANITPQNAEHRLQWCRAHRHWIVDLWKTVLWSDEYRFAVWQSDGRVLVWWMPGERFFNDCIVPDVKFGGGSLMLGGFSWFGLGPLTAVIGNINSEMYGDILDNAALPTLWKYFGEGPFLFQQDNCSIHTSRNAQTWFDEKGVQKLDWPSQRPDLNPIEHL
ncbi:transposable element Tcb2 transposase [Trichonephila clavipes]|nr:transposable element Tcb2 transposase [Trichonephila clavipes]